MIREVAPRLATTLATLAIAIGGTATAAQAQEAHRAVSLDVPTLTYGDDGGVELGPATMNDTECVKKKLGGSDFIERCKTVSNGVLRLVTSETVRTFRGDNGVTDRVKLHRETSYDAFGDKAAPTDETCVMTRKYPDGRVKTGLKCPTPKRPQAPTKPTGSELWNIYV